MTRRNFIALVSLCVLVMLGAIVVGVGMYATQSARGQDMLRDWVQNRIASSINGKVHIGRISGSFLSGVTIDSLELRDDEDSLFFAAGRIGLSYDPRDLVDRRLYFRRIDLQHPTIVLRQHENWKWNYKKLFRMGGPSKPKGPERGFGDFVVLERDGCKLYLVQDAEYAAKDRPELGIETDAIDAIHADIAARRPDLLHPTYPAGGGIVRREYGAREFAVLDSTTVCVVFRDWS